VTSPTRSGARSSLPAGCAGPSVPAGGAEPATAGPAADADVDARDDRARWSRSADSELDGWGFVRTPDPGTAAGAVDPAQRRRRRFGFAMSAVWLFYLAAPVGTAITERTGVTRVVALVDVAVFAAGYLALVVVGWGPRLSTATRVGGLSALAVLSVVAVLALGDSGMTVPVYLIAASTFVLRGRPGLVASIVVVVAAAAAMAAVPALRDWGIAFAFAFVFVIMRVIATNIQRGIELGRANSEIARLAVSEERLRFSRDLHDILGHSLTAISLKAAVANRVLGADPERASAEMVDVERLAREALADVRATVSGYRGVTLAGEVARAHQTLAAAGITAELPAALESVPGSRRELFGWVVREGVTNVVRHSGARYCRIEVAADAVDITDDGCGGVPGAAGGSGLAGLRERVAAAGGRTESGPMVSGGYRLRVEFPA